MENAEILDAVVFSNNEKTFIYDFDKITVEQAELTRELLVFKSNQLNATPNTFKEVVKSSGADFTCLALSYLLRERNIKNEILEFNRDKVDSEVLKFVKNLPAKQLDNINNCINNFFCSINREQQLLEIWQVKSKNNDMRNLALSKIMETMMTMKQTSGN